MELEDFQQLIDSSLKKMDLGFYYEALPNLEKVLKLNFFKKLKIEDQLFIRKRISWIQLSIGHYEIGWKNFTYNWLKNFHKFEKIKSQNNEIKYLIDFNQIKNDEKVLIWNDGGYGDFIYQLRLIKYFDKSIRFKIYDSKMSHLLKNKNLIAKDACGFSWHLPLNEIPRIINYDPTIHNEFDYKYLIEPDNNKTNFSDFVGLTYKTITSKKKTIEYELFEQIFVKKKNIRFLIIQKPLDKYEKNFFSNFSNVNIVDSFDNNFLFQDTFNIVSSLKSLISIDTAITHIAGYHGKKNFLLLPYPSSFYWGYKEKRSVDYKNHLIFRQSSSEDWRSVISELIKKI